MLWHVARFEWRFQRKSPVVWVGFVLFFLLTFGSIVSDGIQIGGSSSVHKNAPFAIVQTTSVLGVFFLFVVVAMVAGVIVRDEETGFAPLLRSTSLGRFDYLVGRFVGAVAVAFAVLASIPLAMAVGSLTPWVDAERLGPQRIGDYAYALFVFGLPTLLVVSAIFFALATLTRSMMACYVGAVALLVLYLVTRGLLRDHVYSTWYALSDPFGLSAVSVVTRYWTAADKNTLRPPLQGLLLGNRLLWLGIAAALFTGTLLRFRFETKTRPSKIAPLVRDLAPALVSPLPLPRSDAHTRWIQLERLGHRGAVAHEIRVAPERRNTSPRMRTRPHAVPMRNLLMGSALWVLGGIAVLACGDDDVADDDSVVDSGASHASSTHFCHPGEWWRRSRRPTTAAMSSRKSCRSGGG